MFGLSIVIQNILIRYMLYFPKAYYMYVYVYTYIYVYVYVQVYDDFYLYYIR